MEQRLRHYRSSVDLNSCGSMDDETHVFRSQWHQGLNANMEWLRLTLDSGPDVTVCVYASDEKEVLDDTPALVCHGPDLILYGVRGRYLRFTVEPSASLRGYTLSFPSRSIDAGLPSIMQGDETLRKYLGIYQSLYMDLNDSFAGIPARLHPMDTAPIPGLEYWTGAARWLRHAPEEIRPQLIACAALLNRIRGTWPGLRLFLRLVTGQDSELHEPFRWRQSISDITERTDCARLYGADSDRVTVLLSEGVSSDILSYLRDTVEDFLPAGIQCDLVSLKAGAPMDSHTYLDRNAKLTEPPPSVLDHTTLEGLIME